MTLQGWGQILLFFVVILALVPPLGAFLHRVLEGERHFLQRPLGWLERLLLRLGGADGREQSWQTYSLGMLAFSAFTMLVTYAIQRMQHLLPLNPQGLGPVEALSAFNTAASFATNTNWQGYAGESTMSHLSQMAGLTVNIVVLFSLILAVGMLVDDAIIVSEFAERRMSEGMAPREAYSLAARRMAGPVVAATADGPAEHHERAAAERQEIVQARLAFVRPRDVHRRREQVGGFPGVADMGRAIAPEGRRGGRTGRPGRRRTVGARRPAG